MRDLQESAHGEGHDYKVGSPHLRHRQLRDRIIDELREVAAGLRARGLPESWLDIGSGHGSFVQHVLAWGFDVTATEMSEPSYAHLVQWYGDSDRFRAVLISDDGPPAPAGTTYSAISGISVLHHIPDYLAAIDALVSGHLAEGGSFVSFQDPLWYPSVGRPTRAAAKSAYYAWRLTQGNYVRGLKTRWRRLRGRYDESEPSDMVEYHVVRSGVNHTEIVNSLSDRFEEVRLVPYWSSQAGVWHRLGTRMGLKNTFGVVARGYRPPQA